MSQLKSGLQESNRIHGEDPGFGFPGVKMSLKYPGEVAQEAAGIWLSNQT